MKFPDLKIHFQVIKIIILANDNILMIKSLHSCIIFDHDFNEFLEDSMVAKMTTGKNSDHKL